MISEFPEHSKRVLQIFKKWEGASLWKESYHK
jgi:hypothetical protein